MKIIHVDPDWSKNVLLLAEKFNRYVQHKSVYNTSRVVDKLVGLLDSDNIIRFEAAQVLSLIEQSNPEIITHHTMQRVNEILWSSPSSSPTYEDTGDYGEVPKIVHQDQPFSTFGTDFGTTGNVFIKREDDVERWPFQNEVFDEGDEDSEFDGGWGEEADSGGGRGQEQEQWTEVNLAASSQEYEVFDPDEDGQQAETPEMLMAKPVSQLGLINVKKTRYDPSSMKGRKCAMGDGVLEGFEGQLWECKECGTIYHESCLKVQAIFEGICKICDAPFLKEKKK
ncbi:MAG: C1 domain-containing protein [Promethearchaeota archaeon]